MSRRQVPVAGSTLRRLLLVLGLLAGVLAMHGFTANHDAMPSTASMTSVAAHSADARHANAEHADAEQGMVPRSPSHLLDHSHLGAALDAEAMGAMGGACVAVLVTSLLLALARRRVATTPLLSRRDCAAGWQGSPDPSPAVGRSLFELCVLRT